MFKLAKNTKQQGDIGLGKAIAYLVSQGYTVSIPLTDSQDYDLVVDINDTINRVQVKTSSNKKDNGSYEVGLRVTGGNKSGNGIAKFFDKNKVEYIFVLLENGNEYFIPTKDLKNTSTITVGKQYKQYKVN